MSMETRIVEELKNIAYKTFEVTCYMFPLEDWELEALVPEGDAEPEKAALVKFDGAAEGGLLIRPDRSLMNGIAMNMLGDDDSTEPLREGALCEIANIICGNTVPLFARDESICYIRPPRIIAINESAGDLFKGYHHEQLEIHLDEGTAKIEIYYSTG